MPRKREKKQTLFVIFAGPQQFDGLGTRYIAKDGKQTGIKSQAAKFYTPTEAQEFANRMNIKRMNIKLTEIRYIGQEDFTDFEVQFKGF